MPSETDISILGRVTFGSVDGMVAALSFWDVEDTASCAQAWRVVSVEASTRTRTA